MATLPSKRLSGSPPSIQDIYNQASNFDYDPSIPLRFWLRTASTMQKEAQVYEREGNDEQTYRVLLRHALLILEKLGKHPEAKNPTYKQPLGEAQKAAGAGLKKLEDIKPRIKKRYDEYQDFARRRSAQVDAQQRRGSKPNIATVTRDIGGLSVNQLPNRESAVYGSKRLLDPSRDQGLAAKLAFREARRRDAARRSVRQAGVSEEEEQERRTGGLWGDWEQELGHQGDDTDDLSRRIQEVGRRREEEYGVAKRNRRTSSGAMSSTQLAYNYPVVPQKSRHQSWNDQTSKPLLPSKLPLQPARISSDIPPQLPPKPYPRRIELSGEEAPPPIPGKFMDSDVSEPVSRAGSQTPPISELNSGDYQFPPHAYLESGEPLRTMFIPPGLRSRFLAIAEPNTRRNIETCGILCGTLISNALFVQKLVIPEQEGTSDTCETVNEGSLFDYMDKEDLMTLGWIHTHPSQTCFMSSRDLHTHSGYQVMLPEAIAIVCAPSKDPSWGCFRLTDPPGLKTILNCTQPGLFHPHGDMDTYTDALRPGHVCEIAALEFDVVDLRPKKP